MPRKQKKQDAKLEKTSLKFLYYNTLTNNIVQELSKQGVDANVLKTIARYTRDRQIYSMYNFLGTMVGISAASDIINAANFIYSINKHGLTLIGNTYRRVRKA